MLTTETRRHGGISFPRRKWKFFAVFPRIRSQKAFTFIEIMIVIVIIGVLMSIGLPRLKGSLGKARLKSAARDVTAVLRTARDVAVLTESRAEIHFDPEKDTYKMLIFDENGEAVEPQRRRRGRSWRDKDNPLAISAEMLRSKRLPDRVHFAVVYGAAGLSEDDELPRVIFYPDGSATPTTLGIQNDDGQSIRVEVYRTTGMTKVLPGLPPEQPQAQRLFYGRRN